MSVYERVKDGRVVETVHTADGSVEDTRLGTAALEGANGWRIQGDKPAEAEQPKRARAKTEEG